ncbi:alanine-glyoxylate transaminase / serine-glyoxylate transaminase / serine-pyruvate transaminase [Geodermatophilus obscurus]|jgi:alanine-glyoxylate transaminase/serine-glyoxylate transaminase/serine-pyruvate transaminase|uniref:Alanine-glyoxylate transaminase / serine-glyoxylate transaminase / serine-pyruvate transaminase n=1 Tax=Geodermatophilus obscurus TaxID=1861 RepID=A0A1I5I1C3_9ACTN|nr:alanine--glyoxylate aminotransferase family protein [Geodermatophilus obscurus]SFO53841.1 alanine-glyoxylate transaminase / serine-glyoxylate transaminase / serine-pyruvate transaminase [Geodermatophilus obscurus]
MPLRARTLLGPGPSNPYPEATVALGQPLLGHLDPVFLGVLDETSERLRTVFGTANRRTLPLSATGSAGMEASFVNTVGPGDVVVVAVNGLFGERMVDVASRCGAEVVRVDHEWGQPVDAERVLAAHPAPKLIAAVHAETSTGVRSDLEPLAAGKGDALLLADCVTSLGGIPVRLDEWGVDLAYSGTQKCLGVAPGLAPFTISDRAWERRIERPQSWYLDLGMLGGYAGEAAGSGGRTYHHTAPTGMVVSLHAGLGRVLDEGLEAVHARHAEAGRLLHEGLQELGLELFAAEGHRLPELTTVRVPDGVDPAAVRKELLERYDLEIGGGVGAYAATVWRIGLMGPNAAPDKVALVLAALREVLGR